MKLWFLSIMIAAGMLLAVPAFALDLHQARDAGIIGEKLDGYVEVLKSSPEAEALANSVNQKRSQEYERISKQNKQPVDIVGSLAAQQIIKGLNSGDYYQDAGGEWKVHK